MSRTTKPIQIYEAAGNPNRLTKAEIERRKSTEMKPKNHLIRASAFVIHDERAYQEFKRLKKLYKDIEFVGSLDEHIINQYCLSVSELDDLVAVYIAARVDAKSKDEATRKIGTRNCLDIDTEVRQKRSEIIKFSDRIYLNPVARTKNTPMKEKSVVNPLAAKGFGNV